MLQLSGEYGLMKDEAYCQVLKQITGNTSSKTYKPAFFPEWANHVGLIVMCEAE